MNLCRIFHLIFFIWAWADLSKRNNVVIETRRVAIAEKMKAMEALQRSESSSEQNQKVPSRPHPDLVLEDIETEPHHTTVSTLVRAVL